MDYLFHFFNGYFFYPHYKDKCWDPDQIKDSNRIVKSTLKTLGSSFFLPEFPNIHFVHEQYWPSIKKELDIRSGTNGIQINSDIYIVYASKKWKVKGILAHEFLHFFFYIKSKNNLHPIPNWFNEAIAYNIYFRPKYSVHQIRKILQSDFPKIKDWIIDDLILDKHNQAILILISFGHYLNTIIPKNKFKLIINRVGDNDFFEQIVCIYGISIIKVIDNWYDWIMSPWFFRELTLWQEKFLKLYD